MNFANNAQSTLSSPLSAGATSLSVASAASFPAAPFHVVIDSELMTVTAAIGTAFTVTRAIEGTSASAHLSGAVVTCVVTAGDISGFGAGGVTSFNTRTGAITLLAADVTPLQNNFDLLSPQLLATNNVGDTSAAAVAGTWNLCAPAAANRTLTLPAPVAGRMVGVRIGPSAALRLTLAQHSTDLIDGAASRTMWAGEKAVLLTDGTDWFKVAGLTIPMQGVMHLAGAQSIPVSVGTTVKLDTTDADNTGLMCDTVNNRITIRRDGQYLCIGAIQYSNVVTAGRYQSRIHRNGVVFGEQEIYSATTVFAMPVGSIVAPQSSGDLLTLVSLWVASGTPPNQALWVTSPTNYLSITEVPSW